MKYLHKRHKPRAIPDPKQPVVIDLVGDNFIDVLKAKDIGEGGLSVYVPYQFKGCIIDREIEIVITLPDRSSFKTTGLIKHKGEKQGFYFGIAFTHVNDKDIRTLKQYIETRIKLGQVVK